MITGKVYVILLLLLFTLAISGGHADTVSYIYDNLNRLEKAEYGGTAYAEYVYDDTGNMTRKTFYETALLVRLAEFTAEMPDGCVLLRWKTLSGPDNAGFHILRSETENGEYARITEFMISSQGEAKNGYSGTTPSSRTTSFSYSSYGQITFIDVPRTDVTDTFAFEYYPNESGHGLNRGMLKKITDGAGHETLFSQYNAWGKPCQIKDINGIATGFTYDVMGRMKTETSAGLTTSYDYNGTGNLTAVHLPGSRDIIYTYTSADLIEKIQDDEGNYIKYFYDTEGNRIKQEIHDKDGVLKQFTDYEPDDYNRLKKIIYPGGAYDEYAYDGNNNITQAKDGKNNITAYG